MAFNQRRKMLRSSLKKLSPNIEKILTDSNIDPATRAENLSIEEYCLITNHLEII
jgi:16S rRNA (adenine1518-N6/adenine1519-N6)-dimethyltransferase